MQTHNNPEKGHGEPWVGGSPPRIRVGMHDSMMKTVRYNLTTDKKHGK